MLSYCMHVDFTAEEKTLVFPRTVGSGGAIILALSAEFQVTADEVNEMDEVFQLELSATDGVGMGIDFSTRQMSVGVIENDDGQWLLKCGCTTRLRFHKIH